MINQYLQLNIQILEKEISEKEKNIAKNNEIGKLKENAKEEDKETEEKESE